MKMNIELVEGAHGLTRKACGGCVTSCSTSQSRLCARVFLKQKGANEGRCMCEMNTSVRGLICMRSHQVVTTQMSGTSHVVINIFNCIVRDNSRLK